MQDERVVAVAERRPPLRQPEQDRFELTERVGSVWPARFEESTDFVAIVQGANREFDRPLAGTMLALDHRHFAIASSVCERIGARSRFVCSGTRSSGVTMAVASAFAQSQIRSAGSERATSAAIERARATFARRFSKIMSTLTVAWSACQV